MIKLHKINIVASLIMIALTIVTCIFSFISFVSVFHLILAIVNILWVVLVLVISFKSKSSKKDKIFYLLGSLWSLLMSVNFIFLYFNIFLEFAILSSIILLVIFVAIYESNTFHNSGESLIENFAEYPFTLFIMSLMFSLLPVLVLWDSIEEVKRCKKETKDKKD